MKCFNSLVTSLCTLLLITSCGRGSDGKFAPPSNSPEDVSQTRTLSTFSYELSHNGCSTGKIVASSASARCENLQNKSLNNGCAEDLRKDYFAEWCPGQEFKAVESAAAPREGEVDVRCTGEVSGSDGRFPFDQIITWNRLLKTQKIVLVPFGDVKGGESHGEFSVSFSAKEKPELDEISIFGYFIDNNKNLNSISTVNAGIDYHHSDESRGPRIVDIHCAPEKPLIQSAIADKMFCATKSGKVRGVPQEKSVFRVEWDGRKTVVKMVTSTEKKDSPKWKVELHPATQNRARYVSLKTSVAGHVVNAFESESATTFVDFLSAWDDHHSEIDCSPIPGGL